MPILPLPIFEADLKAQQEADRLVYDKLRAPRTIVVRFGHMKMVGEFPYDGDAKPGCGSKIVIRSPRGTEIGEMLTSTCPNAGCSKSVTRKEMLDYIENSGGRDYPFFSEGRALRVASPDDMNRQSAIEASKHAIKMDARRRVEALGLPMKIIEAEPILGGERLTIYFASEDRVDFRELVRDLAAEHRTRIEMRQVGARDEARLTADYERCGQHCCCKQFLKVLRPVSMKSAKQQKATLDPLKISGRCGRLMCCLRYEDQTYDELAKRLPRRRQRVGTPEGNGTVIDAQILTQLVLVQLETENRQVAIAVEDLSEPTVAGPGFPVPPPVSFPPAPERASGGPPPEARRAPRDRAHGPFQPRSGPTPIADGPRPPGSSEPIIPQEHPETPFSSQPSPPEDEGGSSKKRRRRRRGRPRPEGGGGAHGTGDRPPGPAA